MVELPTGTVTLVVTDIEGSTRMLRSLGDDYGAVLRAHRAILREAVRRHGGVEFGTEGDACFLAFPARRPPWPPRTARWSGWSACWPGRPPSGAPAGSPLGDHQRTLLSRTLEPASAALGRDVLGAAAADVAGGRPLTLDQALDHAAAWADQRSRDRHDA